MARIDALDILCENQEVTDVAWSQRAKPIGAQNDWGEGGMTRYVTVLARGAFTAGASLMVQLVGFNLDKPEIKEEGDMKDVVVISSTGDIAADEIIEGWRFNLPVPSIGKKYGYVCLRFIPGGGVGINECAAAADLADDKSTTKAKAAKASEPAAQADDTIEVDPLEYCPTLPVLEEPDPAENTFNAWITVGIDSTLDYEYVNQDNVTA